MYVYYVCRLSLGARTKSASAARQSPCMLSALGIADHALAPCACRLCGLQAAAGRGVGARGHKAAGTSWRRQVCTCPVPARPHSCNSDRLFSSCQPLSETSAFCSGERLARKLDNGRRLILAHPACSTAGAQDPSQWLKGTYYDTHARAKAKRAGSTGFGSTGDVTKKAT